MTIIVFLIDTSASMYQRACVGLRPITFIDLAKESVETFMMCRRRFPENNGDRYMLMTLDDPPLNVKAGWKDGMKKLDTELKNLQCYGLTTLRAGLINCFTYLNLNRMQTGIDNYGQGRNPLHHEATLIIVITDGGQLLSKTFQPSHLNMPMFLGIPGKELTHEPFRWDQRVFSLVLRLHGSPTFSSVAGLVPRDVASIDGFCEATGGRSYCVISHRVLIQSIEGLALKANSGVVIRLKKYGLDPPLLVEGDGAIPLWDSNIDNTWLCSLAFLKVPKQLQKNVDIGFWPIPESFWPNACLPSLPPRSAHPEVLFKCINQPVLAIENLPFDKYELHPSPLTQYILLRKQSQVCWQVFVKDSYKLSGCGFPFGYLKASTNLKTVNLYVMPYNYPVLLPLLYELCTTHSMKPSYDWQSQFLSYLDTVPSYYRSYLQTALLRMGLPDILVKSLLPYSDASFSLRISNYLKTLRLEAKSLCEDAPTVACKAASSKNLFNPFDYPRLTLIDQLLCLRNLFFHPSRCYKVWREGQLHSVPIDMMSDYSKHLKHSKLHPPLRQLVPAPERLSTCGNPFKVNKAMFIDEAEVIDLNALSPCKISSPAMLPQSTRKRGALPQGAVFKRPCLLLETSHELSRPLPSSVVQKTDAVEPDHLGVSELPVEDAAKSPGERMLVEIDMNELKALSQRNDISEAAIRDTNQKILKLVLKAVRTPGKNYEPLLSLCKTFGGTVKDREVLLKKVLDELLRFKRKSLANEVNNMLIEDVIQ